jgi:hypothetical protein
MNKVHPKILERILRVSLNKLSKEQTVRITKYILKLIRRSRGRRPKTQVVIEVLSWVLPDLRALLRQEDKHQREQRKVKRERIGVQRRSESENCSPGHKREKSKS